MKVHGSNQQPALLKRTPGANTVHTRPPSKIAKQEGGVVTASTSSCNSAARIVGHVIWAHFMGYWPLSYHTAEDVFVIVLALFSGCLSALDRIPRGRQFRLKLHAILSALFRLPGVHEKVPERSCPPGRGR